MLQTIRERATGWIAYTIIGLIIITFALWGINSYFGDPQTQSVAQVGAGEVSQREFQQAFQEQRQRFPTADTDFLKTLVLEQLINQKLLLEAAREQGLRVSDGQLQQAILAMEVFQESGAFNAERYKQVLRAQGYSEMAFEESLRRALLMEQLQGAVVDSAFVTTPALNGLLSLQKQQRELAYALLPLGRYLEKASVDDNAISAYFEENKTRFQHPEQIKVQYLELDVKAMAKDIPVTEEALKAAYQEQLNRYGRPEERSASYVLVTLAQNADAPAVERARQRAAEIRAALVSGAKTFEQVLEEAKAAPTDDLEGGVLGAIPKGFSGDPAFEAALYALDKEGAVSEPVQTTFGFQLIRLDSLRPAQVKGFEEVRNEVAEELRLRQAEGRFYDSTENFSNLIYEHPDSLEPAAQALGLTVQESDWFTRQGAERGIGAYPQVREAAFSDEVLSQGRNSEPIEVEPNHVIVVRVKEHKPAAPRSLEEAREDIGKQLREREARQALAKDAQAARERVEKGESLEVAAAAFGAEMKKPGLVERQNEAVDRAVLTQAFQLPAPQAGKLSVGTAALSNGDQAVIAVSQVVPGKAEAATEAERTALAQQLAAQKGSEQFNQLVNSLRKRIKVITYTDKL